MKSIVLMRQKEWTLIDTWVSLNDFQDQVFKGYFFHFYPHAEV